jgi:glycosyltransferase involved in cell wall biosynthesis
MRLLTIGSKPTLLQAIADRGDVEVISLERDIPQRATGDSPRYTRLPYDGGPKLSLAAVRQVRCAILQVRPDVIHAFYPRPLAHAVMATRSLRVRTPLVSYRGITSVPHRWSPSEWITYLSPQVTAHACESQAVADALVASGVPGHRCHVVYNCLSRPLPPLSREEARRRLGLAEDDLVVMMVANMRPVKGADILLEAACSLGDIPRLKLVLVGEVRDPRIDQLAAQPELSSRVLLPGFRDDASEVVAGADLFVMPSRAEALSVALLEAMSRGICPVVSDAGGLKEGVRHEVDGLVVPREDPLVLAAAIRRLAVDPAERSRLAKSAQQRASDTFSPARVAERIAAVYRGLSRAA